MNLMLSHTYTMVSQYRRHTFEGPVNHHTHEYMKQYQSMYSQSYETRHTYPGQNELQNILDGLPQTVNFAVVSEVVTERTYERIVDVLSTGLKDEHRRASFVGESFS